MLDNETLLDQFLEREDFDNTTDTKKEVTKDENELDRDPESSFLRISSHLRLALKKHLPWVRIREVVMV